MALLWSSRKARGCCWREWDDGVAVFSESSAATNLLSPLAGAVFLAIVEADGPLSETEVLALFANRASAAPVADDSGDSAAISLVLTELEKIGLIESSPS